MKPVQLYVHAGFIFWPNHTYAKTEVYFLNMTLAHVKRNPNCINLLTVKQSHIMDASDI